MTLLNNKIYLNCLCLPLESEREVILPWSGTSLADCSVRVSQNRIFLSKCPEIMVVAALSEGTKSLQLDPANIVRTPGEEHLNEYMEY